MRDSDSLGKVSVDELDDYSSGKLISGAGEMDNVGGQSPVGEALSRHIDVNPESVEVGLARLVLTVIELLRRLLERQALRRIEGGSLADEEIERLGETFMNLEKRMHEVAAAFGLKVDELNLDLGPLGDLM